MPTNNYPCIACGCVPCRCTGTYPVGSKYMTAGGISGLTQWLPNKALTDAEIDFVKAMVKAQEAAMAKADAKIPKELPKIQDALTTIWQYLENPLEKLHGFSVLSLLRATGMDLSQTYLTGSTAWRPLVTGEAPGVSDIDLIFTKAGSCADFIGKAHQILGEKSKNPYGFSTAPNNKHGFALYVSMGGPKLIDAWDLKYGHIGTVETIAEHVMGYPHDHERVAVWLGDGGGPNSVTRIVRPDKYREPKRPLYDPGS